MPFGVSSGIPNVIIHAKFHVDRLRGFWAAGPQKVPFPILIGTTLTTVLHYRADCEKVRASHTRYRALGPELIPVYRLSARGYCKSSTHRRRSAAITFRQTCGYFSSRRASPPINRYQVILLGDKGT